MESMFIGRFRLTLILIAEHVDPTKRFASWVPWKTLLPLWLFPFKTRRYLDCAVFQPALQGIPVDAFMHSVRVWRRLLVIENPVVRHESRVELAEDTLSDIIDAVFVMPFVHGGYLFDLAHDVREIRTVVILPDVVEAVYLVRANGSCHVPTTCLGGELDGGTDGMIDTLKVRGRHGDHSVFHDRMPGFLHCRGGWALERRVKPKGAVVPCRDIG